jgi:retron-type reverse transcriptase
MLPALYPFGSKERWLEVAPAFFGDESRALVSQLLDRTLIPVINGPEIALYLGVSPRLLSRMAINPSSYYRTFQIQKKNGGQRLITAPRVFLKTIQRYILDCILSELPLHPAATGFRRGSNCSLGADQHVGCRYLWNIDMADFFPSITKAQVTKVFEDNGYPRKAAFFLSGLCCLDRRLPQGAPTSPALSNLVAWPLDEALSDLSSSAQIKYTRYADDLSFSSSQPLSESFRNEVIQIVNRFGFNLQARKTRLMGPAIRREVTGLTVNNQVSIPRFRRRQLRSYFHHIKSDPSSFSTQKNRAIGFASWLFDYHPEEGMKALTVSHSIPDAA